ncbi:MAG: hypothetical protein H7Z10_15460, partial [Gemmatimonadaceae bacterium]|nr:hypothetical protein [Acetobacteraceae bacterium]
SDTLVAVENLIGSDFGDTLGGDGGANAIVGGRGNDCIAGAAGDDALDGGTGRDTLAGGTGADVLTGGMMGDVFVFAALNEGIDRITDFDAADRIDVSAIDADPGTGPDNAFAFIGGAAFTAVGQLRVVQSGGETRVELSTDADSAAEFTIRLDGLVTLIANDFVL